LVNQLAGITCLPSNNIKILQGGAKMQVKEWLSMEKRLPQVVYKDIINISPTVIDFNRVAEISASGETKMLQK